MVNCVFNGCHTNRATKSGKFDNISIFMITSRSGRFHLDWKRDILNIITKYRQVGADLSQQIERGQNYICENHYEPADVEITSKFIVFISILFQEKAKRSVQYFMFGLSKQIDISQL